MEGCRYVAILVSPRIIVTLSSNSQLADATTYRQLIGSLLYLTIYRPNITFVVNLMARFMQKSYVKHLNAVKQILRYVAGNKDLALKYSRLSSFVREIEMIENQPLHMCLALVQVLSLGLPRSNLLSLFPP